MKLFFLGFLLIGQVVIQTEGSIIGSCFGKACETIKSFIRCCAAYAPSPPAIFKNKGIPQEYIPKGTWSPKLSRPSSNPAIANQPAPAPSSAAPSPVEKTPTSSPAQETQTQSADEEIIPIQLEENKDICLKETCEPLSEAEIKTARGLVIQSYMCSYEKGIRDRTIPFMRGIIMPLRQTDPMKDTWSPDYYPVKSLCMKLHNDLRQKHHAEPLAFNWNAVTANFLQSRIDRMAADHAEKLSKSIAKYGEDINMRSDNTQSENVYYTYSQWAGYSAEEVLTMAIQSWYAQSKNYKDYGQPNPYTWSKKNIDQFTAMVWRSSVSMGLGMSKYTDKSTNLTYYVVVVNYFPPGNIRGQYHINVKAENDTIIEDLPPITTWEPLLSGRQFKFMNLLQKQL
ncbi:hypothetical protein WDU94_009896 [Cyamophila willieti]